MQKHHFTYEELTPLEQCILTFMQAQEAQTRRVTPRPRRQEPPARKAD
ncbi:MAG: hypothetical protein V4735_03600 [Pseudomonadota bacterium]